MKEEYEIRFFRRGDEDEILGLLRLAFDGWPHMDLNCSAIEHWRWKHEDNPSGKSIVSVGVSEGKIMGCSHTIPMRMKIKNGVFLCCNGVDVAVHPHYRRMGVYGNMLDFKRRFEKKAGMKLHFTCTGNRILINRLSKRESRFPFKIVNLVRILDISKHLKAMPIKKGWFMKLGYRFVKFMNELKNAYIAPVSISDLQISDVNRFDEKTAEFYKQVSDHYDFILERNPEYLNWRYCDPRAGNFLVRLVREEDRVLGYSVLKINRYKVDYPVGFIVDLLTLPKRVDVAEALAMDAVNYFDQNDVNIVNYLVVQGHPYEDVLKRCGFLDSRIEINLFYKALANSDELSRVKKSSANSIFFSWGDHDSLPIQ